jgi:surface protein
VGIVTNPVLLENISHSATTVRRAWFFNGNLKRWQTSSVSTMAQMFQNCFYYTGDGLDAWDTSNVMDMSYMFRFTPSFNGDLSNWNVSKVTNMRSMFQEAIAFNSDLSKWDLSRVTDISQMVRCDTCRGQFDYFYVCFLT